MITLEAHVERLLAAVQSVLRDGDAESVHLLRTALARIDAWLALAELRSLRREVRWLRKRAATVRDLDVMLSLELPASVIRVLVPRRVVAQRRLMTVLRGARAKKIVRDLAGHPPLEVAQSTERIRKIARRARLPRDAAGRSDEALHALRRRLRKLRYSLEVLGHATEPVQNLVAALGHARDHTLAAERIGSEDDGAALRRHHRRAAKKWSRLVRRLWQPAATVIASIVREGVPVDARGRRSGGRTQNS